MSSGMKELFDNIKDSISRINTYFGFSTAKDSALIILLYAYFTENEKKFRNKLGKEYLGDEIYDTPRLIANRFSLLSEWLKINHKDLFEVFDDSFRNITSYAAKSRENSSCFGSLIEYTRIFQKKVNNYNENSLVYLFDNYLKLFSELGWKNSGESFTPRSIVRLIIRLSPPKRNGVVFDPVCGSGGFLSEALKYSQANYPDNERPIVYGIDRNLEAVKLAKVNLILNGIRSSNIEHDNFIINSIMSNKQNAYIKYDSIYANPPFSVKDWIGKNYLKEFGEVFKYGLPPLQYGDYAFIELVLSHLKENGIAVMLSSEGILFRSGQEREIRKNLLQAGCIDSVIKLPPNLLPDTKIPVIILLLRSPTIEKNVFIFNAENYYTKINNRTTLTSEDINVICEVFDLRKDIKNMSKNISLKDIENNDFNLSVLRYIENVIPENSLTLVELNNNQEEFYKELTDIRAERKKYFNDF